MLFISSNELSSQIPIKDLRVKTRLFANMTSARLELRTVLWALNIFNRAFLRGEQRNPTILT